MKRTIYLKAVGGCSDTSKMPGASYGLPTAECKTGSKLAKIPGTVCSKCYANKGHYGMYPQIKVAQYRRLHAMRSPDWVENMVKVLNTERWFRWFDSGDLQDSDMLSQIVEVSRQTPWCQHWLATRERRIVREYVAKHTLPENLCIRLSATYPDKPVKPLDGVCTATVHKEKAPLGFECRAPYQQGKCDLCRACWNKEVVNVSYRQH